MVVIKPILVVVTGRPASGKTTLSRLLASTIKCPLVSRDELKEGYINTFHDLASGSAADIYKLFFQTIDLLLSGNISIIAEAAFQHKLWHPQLMPLIDKAAIRMIICETSPKIATERFTERLAADPDREKFHGDSEELLKDADSSLMNIYQAPNLPVPTLRVDTTKGYQPAMTEIIKFIRSEHRLVP